VLQQDKNYLEKEAVAELKSPLKDEMEVKQVSNIKTLPPSTTHSKRVIPIIVEPEEPTKSTKSKKSSQAEPKVRQLRLPAAILGAKPGAEPNVKHLEQEGETKRKIRTASTTAVKRTVPGYGSGGFVVIPASAKFGNVVAGTERIVQLTMTNVGLDSARFTVRQPKTEGIKIRYKHGPVAPGMTAQLSIVLNLPNQSCEQYQIVDEFQLVSETEILHIPIKATINHNK
jgi:hypothetical protein